METFTQLKVKKEIQRKLANKIVEYSREINRSRRNIKQTKEKYVNAVTRLFYLNEEVKKLEEKTKQIHDITVKVELLKNISDIIKTQIQGGEISVITYLEDNNNTTISYKGTAQCNPNDTFDIEIGFCIAHTRAMLGKHYKDIVNKIKKDYNK